MTRHATPEDLAAFMHATSNGAHAPRIDVPGQCVPCDAARTEADQLRTRVAELETQLASLANYTPREMRLIAERDAPLLRAEVAEGKTGTKV